MIYKAHEIRLYPTKSAVIGAAPGDVVALGIPSASMAGFSNSSSFFAWVSATDVVSVAYVDPSASFDPPSGTYTVKVFQ